MPNGHVDTVRAYPVSVDTVAAAPARQAFRLLHFAFAITPIIAGIDKFFHYLVDWGIYLSPRVANLSPISANYLMQAIGMVEIIVGLIVAFWPRIGAWLVVLWLWAIIVNLLMLPGFYDVALRDFGLSLGALALARLSRDFA